MNNFTSIQKETILNLINSKEEHQFNAQCLKKHYNELFNDLLTWSFPNDFKFSQKLYHYLYDDRE